MADTPNLNYVLVATKKTIECSFSLPLRSPHPICRDIPNIDTRNM